MNMYAQRMHDVIITHHTNCTTEQCRHTLYYSTVHGYWCMLTHIWTIIQLPIQMAVSSILKTQYLYICVTLYSGVGVGAYGTYYNLSMVSFT